ncbi:uroporphyrinogen-III C-methyltransferase [Nitratifractor sp.]|uniref:uroporphyrinogen-III C-methyltransferase n=1 Tax=Nitratifractor sp. TaxID=2268144 RepID=UPI0025E0E9D6|nr:uroporphyrinogen-III C-methyltransferase [Nitratifractor sp.]
MVYLTGAGPGALDLLTIKALRVIRQADVIIYDRLANPEILAEAKDGCKFIYVGKADSHHTLPQEEINETIYRAALEYETVVRLKGGDPLVFGRGGEEGIYLRRRGVKFEFVPGVTSAIAVPEYAGIPVTHRGITVSFRVVTGHEAAKEKSQIPWENYRTDDTIVFLMGLHRLHYIVEKLLEIGKPEDFPIAVISKGTWPDEKTVIGTLENIVERARGLQTPALIVVGRVVELHEELSWFEGEDENS